jgi:hypothetical protein
MCLSSKFAYRSAAGRYRRGRTGFASFAARPCLAMRGSRSASSRRKGGACYASNCATGASAPDASLVTVAALRCARLGISRRRPNSGETAAFSMPRSQRAEAPWPFGQAGEAGLSCTCATLDIGTAVS